MTNDEHRKLDARVAEEVMGWSDVNKLPGSEPTATNGINTSGERGRVPHYSSNIADAWMVVEGMRKRGYSVSITTNNCADGQNGVLFQEGYKNLGKQLLRPDYEPDELTVEATVPLSICRAALQAIRTEEKENA